MQSSFKYCHGVHTELNEAMKWMCTYTHNIIKRTGIVGHTIQFLAGSAYKELHKSTAPYYHAGVTEIHAWASPLGMCAIGYRNSTTRRRCMLHLSVRESGRSWEAIRPVQKKFPCILRIARVGHYTKEPTDIIILISVRESGRSREAIRPYKKKFPFSGSLELDTTQKSPLTQPAMAPAPD